MPPANAPTASHSGAGLVALARHDGSVLMLTQAEAQAIAHLLSPAGAAANGVAQHLAEHGRLTRGIAG